MNMDNIKGKWREIKGELQKTWGRITDDEWESTKGDMTAVSGLIQQRYGDKKEEVSQKVSRMYDKYVSQPVREKLERDKTEDKH